MPEQVRSAVGIYTLINGVSESALTAALKNVQAEAVPAYWYRVHIDSRSRAQETVIL